MRRVDDRYNPLIAQRLIKRFCRWKESRQAPDPGRVARLHRVNGESSREVGPRLDLRCLLLIGGCGQVLKRDRGAPKRIRVLRDAMKIEARLLDRRRAEYGLESLHVFALVHADDVRLVRQRSVQGADPFCLRVEGSLEVLERKREVEDRHIVRA